MGHVDLCGFVQCGKDTFFGSGSRVLPHGKVGDGAFVGAGSVVLKKVKAGDKVFGVPAVSIKNLEG
jgi:acetyltransferase-like isoleucine patch superfamily enzyme